MTCSRPLICAHRGFSGIAPENTLVAFRKAIEVGADITECDARRTRDGEIVLLHDPALDRTTNGSGPVAERTLAEVCQLDAGSWKAEEFAGERIPTLREVIQLTKGRIVLTIELKAEGIEADVLRIIRECDAVGDVRIVSFQHEACVRCRQFEPRIPVAWILGRVEEGQARELVNRCLCGHIQALSVQHTSVTPALRRETRLAGLGLWAWTANEPDLVRRLIAMGVDVITSDWPDMALQVE